MFYYYEWQEIAQILCPMKYVYLFKSKITVTMKLFRQGCKDLITVYWYHVCSTTKTITK